MKEKLMTLKKTNHDITLENMELNKKASLLRNDLQYIEMVVRNELEMVRKDDLIYRYLK
jgi:cell division protein FtsB